MPSDPRMRASDQDRDRVAALLREHHAVGRLDAEEFNERLDKALAAKTLGELDELTADLPAIDLYPLPTTQVPGGRRATADFSAASVGAAIARGRGRFSPAWQAAWGSWFTCSLVCTVIWMLTGFGYPWPLWVAGPWGAIMAARWIAGSPPEGHRRRGQLPDDQRGEISGPPGAS
jgi:DUF1707 SHOCT-like domain